MAYLKQTANTNNFLEVLLRDHERYMPIMEYLDNLTQQESELSWEERERISLEVSKCNGAEFCVAIHAGMLKAFGSEPTNINMDKLEPALAFTRKLVKESNKVSQDDIDQLRRVGWSDQTIEDIVGLVSAITIYDVLANGFGFKASLPTEVFEEMGKNTIDSGGFVAQFKSFLS